MSRARTDKQIIKQTEEVARRFLFMIDFCVKEGVNIRHLKHPKARKAWGLACEVQEIITKTDVQNSLDNLEDQESE